MISFSPVVSDAGCLEFESHTARVTVWGLRPPEHDYTGHSIRTERLLRVKKHRKNEDLMPRYGTLAQAYIYIYIYM